jgi:hypothetical protein
LVAYLRPGLQGLGGAFFNLLFDPESSAGPVLDVDSPCAPGAGRGVSDTLQGFPPIATISLGNTTNSVAIEGYYCTETVIRLQFVCLLQHKICVAIFIFCVATS